MKAERKTVYGVYTTDGYTSGPYIAYYPISAAAHGSPELIAQRGYAGVGAVEVVQFEDLCYVMQREFDKSKIIGYTLLYTPTECYEETLNHGKRYYVGDEEIIKTLNDGGSHNIRKVWVIRDEQSYFVLKQKEPIQINKFAMSRELAVAHALQKLTDEEKGLLGLK